MADDNLLSPSIASLLNDDIGGLRNKYYNYLDQGLNASSSPAPLDDSALLWRGIIPAIATALLTKGKAAQFAGAPLQGVLEGEEKKAELRQKLDIDTNLKRAGLIQETLEQKEKNQLDEFQRVENAQLRREEGEANRDLRRDIASQGHMDRMAIRGDRRDRDKKTETRQLTQDFENEANKLGIQKQTSSVADVKALLNGPQNAITQGQLSTKVLRMSSEVGNAAVKERAITLPPTLQAKVTAWQNWIDSGAKGPLPEKQLDGLKELTKIYEQSINDKVLKLRENRRNVFKGSSLLEEKDFDEVVNGLGSHYLTGEQMSSKDQLKALLRNNPQLLNQGQ